VDNTDRMGSGATAFLGEDDAVTPAAAPTTPSPLAAPTN
jgi:hypothetical protein